MARRVAALLLLACGSCMEMRETVERTVMVRTTGSDLQPAATGYIYKKESDGKAKVTKMGESEVMQHFSKLYHHPEPYKADSAGHFYRKGADDDKAASHTNEEIVKPVVEVTGDEKIDGIANEDYDKMFEEYAKKFRHYKDDFPDYLHGVGHYGHTVHHVYGDAKDFAPSQRYGESERDLHSPYEHFGKEGEEDYHPGKHRDYGYKEHESYEPRHHYTLGYKEDDPSTDGHAKGEAVDRFHKDFYKDGHEEVHDVYQPFKGRHHGHRESDAVRSQDGGSHVSERVESGHGKGEYDDRGSDRDADVHSAQASAPKGRRAFSLERERIESNGFGYEIEH